MSGFKRFLASIAAVLLVCGLVGCRENEVGDSRGDTESGQFSESIRSSDSNQFSDNGQLAENSQPTEGSRPMESSQPLESGQTSSSDTMSGVSNKTENLKGSEVEAANKMAADGKKLFEKFLAEAAAKGYGIERGNGDINIISLGVEGGVWSCDSDIIDHSREIGWCGGAFEITADTPEDKAKYAEDFLCIKFAKEFKDLKNALFFFTVLDGECTGAAYTGVSEPGGDFKLFDPVEFGGRFPESYGWNSGEQGIVVDKYSGKKLIVGTSPVVKMDDKAELLGRSEVEAANKMAADGKKLFEEIFSDTDIKGDGVNADLVVVTADNGIWNCMADGDGYPEELFRSVFSKKYKDLKSAAFCFVVFNGKCTGAIYLDVPYGGVDEGFEIFDLGNNGGRFPASYKWSGDEAGIVVSKETGKTYAVGTSPVVEMNDAAVIHYDDDAHTYAYRNAKAMYRSLNNFLDGIEKRGLGINKLDEPHMLLIRVSYGGYGVDFDDELMIDAESMAKFCMSLTHTVKDEFQYSNAWVKAYIVNGKCEGVVFMSSGGGDYEHPTYADFKKGSYRWDSADDIGSVNGITMGVYPELSYSKN